MSDTGYMLIGLGFCIFVLALFVGAIILIIKLIKKLLTAGKSDKKGSKNKLPWQIIISAIAILLGIILIANNATPYANCQNWIQYPDNLKLYAYALQRIDEVRTGYFSGIFLLAGGIIGGALTFIFRKLKKSEPKISEEIITDFD